MPNRKYDGNNVFARILRGELSCDKVYESDDVLAFYDKFPDAPVHVLVIPKEEYISFDDFMKKASASKICDFFQTVQLVAALLDLPESGYRIVSNHGSDGMQAIDHFHVHILGKKKLGGMAIGDKYHENLMPSDK